MAKYRIVEDIYCGFEVQAWRWYWPWWTTCNFSNTHRSVERAELWLNGYRNKVVKYID